MLDNTEFVHRPKIIKVFKCKHILCEQGSRSQFINWSGGGMNDRHTSTHNISYNIIILRTVVIEYMYVKKNL